MRRQQPAAVSSARVDRRITCRARRWVVAASSRLQACARLPGLRGRWAQTLACRAGRWLWWSSCRSWLWAWGPPAAASSCGRAGGGSAGGTCGCAHLLPMPVSGLGVWGVAAGCGFIMWAWLGTPPARRRQRRRHMQVRPPICRGTCWGICPHSMHLQLQLGGRGRGLGVCACVPERPCSCSAGWSRASACSCRGQQRMCRTRSSGRVLPLAPHMAAHCLPCLAQALSRPGCAAGRQDRPCLAPAGQSPAGAAP